MDGYFENDANNFYDYFNNDDSNDDNNNINDNDMEVKVGF